MPLTGSPLDVRPDRRRTARRSSSRSTTTRGPARRAGSTTPTSCSRRSSRRGTRFAAVFHSGDANPVGPIRSGRTQDVDLLGVAQPAAVRVERRQRRRHPGDRRLRLRRPQPERRARGYVPAPGQQRRPAQLLLRHRRAVGAGDAGGRAGRRRCSPTSTPGEALAGDAGRRRRRADGQPTASHWDVGPGARRATVRSTNGAPHDDADTGEQVNADQRRRAGRRRTGRAPSTPAAPRRMTHRRRHGVGVHRRQDGRRARGCATTALEPASPCSTPTARRSSCTPGRTWVELADADDDATGDRPDVPAGCHGTTCCRGAVRRSLAWTP